MLTYHATTDLALTYALRRPKLAMSLAYEALKAAVTLGRPDLTWRANELISAIGGEL